jgi:hypothetical protein
VEPSEEVAAQKVADEQVRARMLVPGASADCQSAAPAAGLAEYSSWLEPSAARQKEALGQVRSLIAAGELAGLAEVHAEAPLAGSVEVRTLPRSSVATHSETEGQDRPVSVVPSSTVKAVQEGPGSSGAVDTRSFPESPPVTHSAALGQASR